MAISVISFPCPGCALALQRKKWSCGNHHIEGGKSHKCPSTNHLFTVCFVISCLYTGCALLVQNKRWSVSSFHVHIRAVSWQCKDKSGELRHSMSTPGLCSGSANEKNVVEIRYLMCTLGLYFGIAKKKNGQLHHIMSMSDLCSGIATKNDGYLRYFLPMSKLYSSIAN